MGTSYDGRDTAARLSVKLDRTVITNVVDVEVDDDTLVGTEPIFGGQTDVKTKFTGEAPYLVLVRPKSFAAEPSGGGEADVEDLDVPDLGSSGGAVVTERHVEGIVGDVHKVMPQLIEALSNRS